MQGMGRKSGLRRRRFERKVCQAVCVIEVA
jgi:hypothetical protein